MVICLDKDTLSCVTCRRKIERALWVISIELGFSGEFCDVGLSCIIYTRKSGLPVHDRIFENFWKSKYRPKLLIWFLGITHQRVSLEILWAIRKNWSCPEILDGYGKSLLKYRSFLFFFPPSRVCKWYLVVGITWRVFGVASKFNSDIQAIFRVRTLPLHGFSSSSDFYLNGLLFEFTSPFRDVSIFMAPFQAFQHVILDTKPISITPVLSLAQTPPGQNDHSRQKQITRWKYNFVWNIRMGHEYTGTASLVTLIMSSDIS